MGIQEHARHVAHGENHMLFLGYENSITPSLHVKRIRCTFFSDQNNLQIMPFIAHNVFLLIFFI
jgi:hypothetical protein